METDSFSANQKAAIGIVALLFIVGGMYLFWNSSSLQTDTAATTTQQISTTTLVVSTPHGTYTLEQLPEKPRAGVVAPNFKAPISFSSSTDAEVQAALNAKFVQLQAAISKDKTDFNAWIALGGIYKMGGDYARAATIWEYVSKAWPMNAVSYGNLGDMYMNFTHDYKKAETAYLTEIKNNPDHISAYINVFDLYTSGLYTPSANAGEQVLIKGVLANPKSIELHMALARYYKSLGKTAEARGQYDLSYSLAKEQNQTALVDQIAAEEAGLTQ